MRITLLLAVAALAVVAISSGRAHEPVKPGDPPEKEAFAGKAVNGLQLSLTTDKTEIGVKDGKRAVLRLTFTNVGDKHIKFNAYDFRWVLIRGEVKATPADSVEYKRAAADRKLVPPRPADFPELKPGQSWSFDRDLTFPGWIPQGGNALNSYSVVKPGEFRIKFTYTSTKIDSPVADGIWTGGLVSNEVVVKAKE
jgi:hypothetical protein